MGMLQGLELVYYISVQSLMEDQKAMSGEPLTDYDRRMYRILLCGLLETARFISTEENKMAMFREFFYD